MSITWSFNISVAQASNASVIITENSSSTSAIGFRNMIKYSPHNYLFISTAMESVFSTVEFTSRIFPKLPSGNP